MRRLIPSAILLSIVLTACGGGGGGGGSSDAFAPMLKTASVLVAGATPAAGDTLLLTFTEDVRIVSGTLLTDADLAISAGGTLGAIVSPPAADSARTVRVTLGAGVDLTPGTTLLSLGVGNDVIQDLAGNLGVSNAGTTLTTGDGDVPTVTRVTVSGLDDELNGNGPAGGTAQTPRNAFTIDVWASDPTSAIDPARTSISVNVEVQGPTGSLPPGAELAGLMQPGNISAATNSFFVPGTVTLPEGNVTVRAFATDVTGRTSRASRSRSA